MGLKSIIESLIFAAERPLGVQKICQVTGAPRDDVKGILTDLEAEYRQSGVQLAEVGGGYQFRTNPENADWVRKLLAGRPARLTRPMLETLAIISYRQPVTRPEVEEIRGVDSGGTLRVLLERNLVRIVGKKEEPGRPLLYGTTRYFLEFFQLKSLRELPSLRQFAELSEEHAEQVARTFGEQAARAEGAAEEGSPAADLAAAAVTAATEERPPLRPDPEPPSAGEEDEAALAALDRAVERASQVLETSGAADER